MLTYGFILFFGMILRISSSKMVWRRGLHQRLFFGRLGLTMARMDPGRRLTVNPASISALECEDMVVLYAFVECVGQILENWFFRTGTAIKTTPKCKTTIIVWNLRVHFTCESSLRYSDLRQCYSPCNIPRTTGSQVDH